jgi:hypothetical protein
MFFILSINTKKNTANIVGHARTLEQAIESVQEHAKNYVIAKNEPVLHRGADEGSVKFTERVHYYTRDCPDHVHQIDVFRQQTKKIKGWTGNSYQEDSQLVRRFAYDEYKGVTEEAKEEEEEEVIDSEELMALRAARARAMGLRHTNTVGGFPKDVMTSLRESNAFQRHRETSESNKLPPPYKHTVFVDSDEDETESEQA